MARRDTERNRTDVGGGGWGRHLLLYSAGWILMGQLHVQLGSEVGEGNIDILP